MCRRRKACHRCRDGEQGGQSNATPPKEMLAAFIRLTAGFMPDQAEDMKRVITYRYRK